MSPLNLAQDLPRDVEDNYLLLLGALVIDTTTDEDDILVILDGDRGGIKPQGGIEFDHLPFLVGWLQLQV